MFLARWKNCSVSGRIVRFWHVTDVKRSISINAVYIMDKIEYIFGCLWYASEKENGGDNMKRMKALVVMVLFCCLIVAQGADAGIAPATHKHDAYCTVKNPKITITSTFAFDEYSAFSKRVGPIKGNHGETYGNGEAITTKLISSVDFSISDDLLNAALKFKYVRERSVSNIYISAPLFAGQFGAMYERKHFKVYKITYTKTPVCIITGKEVPEKRTVTYGYVKIAQEPYVGVDLIWKYFNYENVPNTIGSAFCK